MPSGWKTRLIYHVDKSLGIVPGEATDHVTFVRGREGRLNQRTKFARSKCALDQTLTGWSVGVEKMRVNQRTVSIMRETGESVAENAPLWATDVVAMSSEPMAATDGVLSIAPRFSSKRLPSVSWISSLYPLSFSLYSMDGVFAPLLRVRSSLHMVLELFGTVSGRSPLSYALDAPLQILESSPHRLAETFRILSSDCGCQGLAHVKTIVYQLYGTAVVNRLVLVGAAGENP